MSGYCATGKNISEMAPTITMRMAITIATIGRLMKNRLMALSFPLAGTDAESPVLRS